MAREIPRKWKVRLVLAPIAMVLLLAAFLGGRYWWYRGYSKGTRTGVIRKVTEKGPPYCKYLSAEMVVQTGGITSAADVWEFSVDDDAPTAPVVVALRAAEKTGERVTIDYRQDLGSLYRCTPSEYFATKVEK
jgi:hypothetical protein